jgi:hypothetical protein
MDGFKHIPTPLGVDVFLDAVILRDKSVISDKELSIQEKTPDIQFIPSRRAVGARDFLSKS